MTKSRKMNSWLGGRESWEWPSLPEPATEETAVGTDRRADKGKVKFGSTRFSLPSMVLPESDQVPFILIKWKENLTRYLDTKCFLLFPLQFPFLFAELCLKTVLKIQSLTNDLSPGHNLFSFSLAPHWHFAQFHSRCAPLREVS